MNPNTTEVTTVATVAPIAPLWQSQLIRVLQLLGVLLTFLGTADALNLLQIFAPETAKWLAISGGALASSAKPLLLLVGDWFDNGAIDGSFKLVSVKPDPNQTQFPFGVLLACLLPFALVSCVGLTSGLTGQPISSVPVQRVDGGEPFNVAGSDVFRAETTPGRIWGLYDAGTVAAATGQVVEAGK